MNPVASPGPLSRSKPDQPVYINLTGSFFWYRHFNGIPSHMFWAAFHQTVVRHASWLSGTHSPVHALRAAKTTMHTMVAFLHHHLMLAIVMTGKTMMCHPANASSYKTNEKDESYYDKEPRDKRKEFAGRVFSEFCKQQGTCKNSQ